MNSNTFRFIVLFFVLLLILICPIANNNLDFNNLKATNLKIYYLNNIQFENEKIFKNGIGCYIMPNIDIVEQYISNTNFDGIEFQTSISESNILQNLNAKIIKKQSISLNNEEKLIIYAYTNKFNKFVMLENQKVNVQIVVSNSENTVGLPLILGSY